MPKANSALITSERAAPTRRALLCTATAGLAAAVPTLCAALRSTALAGAPQSPSRLFLEYQKRHTEWLALFDYEGECPRCGSPEEEAFDALTTEYSEPMWAAIHRIRERTPRSWNDVTELAQVVYDQLWDENGKHSSNRELEGSLFDAIFAMAEGGAHA